jgi:hypothetical protein
LLIQLGPQTYVPDRLHKHRVLPVSHRTAPLDVRQSGFRQAILRFLISDAQVCKSVIG